MRHLILALAVVTPAVCVAQASEAAKPKAAVQQATDARTLGWQVRADGKADATKFTFVEMKPGWHVTSGPVSGVTFHPGMTGTGNYSAKMAVYFFPPKSTHHEGYGLVVGGKDLVGAGQQYTYFLVRNDGKYTIKRRMGDSTSTLVNWTASESLKLWKEGGPNALNILRVDAGSEAVEFRINDVVVATKPRKELGVDGVVGMRVNHFLDLHVSELTVTAAK